MGSQDLAAVNCQIAVARMRWQFELLNLSRREPCNAMYTKKKSMFFDLEAARF